LRGARWYALGRSGLCVGEYALRLGTAEGQRIVDRLVNAGVQTELLFRALENSRRVNEKKNSRFYFKSKVRYEGGDLIDADG